MYRWAEPEPEESPDEEPVAGTASEDGGQPEAEEQPETPASAAATNTAAGSKDQASE